MYKYTKAQLVERAGRAARELQRCKEDLRQSQQQCAAHVVTINQLRAKLEDVQPAPVAPRTQERVVRRGRKEDEVLIAQLRAEIDLLRRELAT